MTFDFHNLIADYWLNVRSYTILCQKMNKFTWKCSSVVFNFFECFPINNDVFYVYTEHAHAYTRTYINSHTKYYIYTDQVLINNIINIYYILSTRSCATKRFAKNRNKNSMTRLFPNNRMQSCSWRVYHIYTSHMRIPSRCCYSERKCI